MNAFYLNRTKWYANFDHVTLPPDISHIATRSFFWVELLSQSGCCVSIFGFSAESVSPVFSRSEKDTCYIHNVMGDVVAQLVERRP